VVAHGVGASTLTMALLAGLQGVKSAVCSQVSTDLVLPAAMKRKADLRLTSVAAAAGIDTMTTTPLDPTCGDQALDALLRLQPVDREERCTSAVCHRITAMYGELYQHAQLSEATHATLGEEFGVVSVRAFSHLSLLGRVGHLVDESGAEAYLPRLERLALPMLLPEATAITLRRLTEANGAAWYSRRLIPGYGHVDCIIGQHASRDVYPHILSHLEATA
jgi:cholesterol oxidase